MDTTSIHLNGHTVACILIDPAPLDPRTIDPQADAAEDLYVGDVDLIGGTRDSAVVAPHWFDTFRKLVYRYEPAVALRAMNILRSLGAELPAYIGIRRYKGYTQGDWADLVISGSSEEVAEGYYQTYAAWARGDVYGIMLERKCPITGGWFTAEDELALYGNYWSGIGNFEEEVREIAELHWNLDEQPISEEGEELKFRKELKESIRTRIERFELLAAGIERFELLTAASGDSAMALAKDIFASYEELIDSLEGIDGD